MKVEKPFIFNEASKQGLYYDWGSSTGIKYTCVSYSAGTTYALQKLANPDAKLTGPEVLIFSNNDVNSKEQKKPIASLQFPPIKVQAIRSALMIDDNSCPYVLLGTFYYPDPKSPINYVELLKWEFLNNKMPVVLAKFEGNGNSIRRIIRYTNKNNVDNIYFSFQNDSSIAATKISKIYSFPTCLARTNKDIKEKIKTFNLYDNLTPLTGTVWDFSLDKENIYISIPIISKDVQKLSGFSTKGRVFYQKIVKFNRTTQLTTDIKLYSLIGNDKYAAGFGIDHLSTFQIIPMKDEIIIYSLSDFVYQIFALLAQQGDLKQILLNLLIKFKYNIFELTKYLASNLDIKGSKIFKVNKSDMYKETIPNVYTLVGKAPQNTINLSNTMDGYNNFANLYVWSATADNKTKTIYLGTLDIRSSLFDSLLVIFKNEPIIYNILKNLSEKNKILITELLFDTEVTFPIDYKNKQLFFDILKIEQTNNISYKISKITSNGFRASGPTLSDEGVRNINIVHNTSGKYLLVGSTCYQDTNVAKNYTLKIE